MIRFACWVCKQEFFALVDPPPRVCNDCAEASLAVPFLDTKDARIAELEAEVARLSVNGFGTSVDDSHELLKLRELLDDVGVWPSEKAEQDGDYEACVRHMAERIAELEAKLAALTVRQPMETAPRDGTTVFIETTDGVAWALPMRFLRGYWRNSARGVVFPEDLCLGWYALPEEVSRG